MGQSGGSDAMGGIQTAAGAVMLATGNPAGVPLLINGASQLSQSGNQGGGAQPSPLGALAGGAGGSPAGGSPSSLGGALGPLAQQFMKMSQPQQMPTPQAPPRMASNAPSPQPPQVQAPPAPQVPSSTGASPLMALLQQLAQGVKVG